MSEDQKQNKGCSYFDLEAKIADLDRAGGRVPGGPAGRRRR
jgi:hypothetical protein